MTSALHTQVRVVLKGTKPCSACYMPMKNIYGWMWVCLSFYDLRHEGQQLFLPLVPRRHFLVRVECLEHGRGWEQCCTEVPGLCMDSGLLDMVNQAPQMTAHTLACFFSFLDNMCIGVLRLLKLCLSEIWLNLCGYRTLVFFGQKCVCVSFLCLVSLGTGSRTPLRHHGCSRILYINTI